MQRNEIRDKINYLDGLQSVLTVVDGYIETNEDYLKNEEEGKGMYEYYSVRKQIWEEIQKFLEKKI